MEGPSCYGSVVGAVPLFQLALDVRSDLDRRFAEVAREPGVAEFCARVRRDGRLTMNLKPDRMQVFVQIGRIQHVFEYAAGFAAPGSPAYVDKLRECLRTWYRDRVDFEQRWAGDRHFYYGVLNIGGLGPSRYGDYCIVSARDQFEAWDRLCYLWGDSLREFYDQGQFLEQRLRDGVATPQDAASLASLKFCGKLSTLPAPEWPSLFGENEQEIEAVFVDSLVLRDICEVRMARTKVDELQRMARAALLGSGSVDDLDVVRHGQVLSALANAEIPLVTVDS